MNAFNAARRFGPLLGLALVVGCAGGRPSLVPNSNPDLRKASVEFAADAAKREYKPDAPRAAGVQGRAQVGYMLNRLDVINLSNDEWDNTEIWVNQKYVVFLPKMKPNELQSIDFEMLYDQSGHYFPTHSLKEKVAKVEAYTGGKMYEIPVKLAD
jgi:hypothetical protein